MQSETADKKNNPRPSSFYRHGRHSNLALTHSDAADFSENVCLFLLQEGERNSNNKTTTTTGNISFRAHIGHESGRMVSRS